jgi:hypothetical protein
VRGLLLIKSVAKTLMLMISQLAQILNESSC